MITRRTRNILEKMMAGSMLALILLLSLSFTKEVFAQTDPTKYTSLTTIPGFTEAGKQVNPIEKIKNLYGVAIGIAAVLAVVMIIYAGLEYTTTEAITGKSDAKDRWQGALLGLGLLLGSYLLLRTINIDLVNINLDLGKSEVGDLVPSGTTQASCYKIPSGSRAGPTVEKCFSTVTQCQSDQVTNTSTGKTACLTLSPTEAEKKYRFYFTYTVFSRASRGPSSVTMNPVYSPTREACEALRTTTMNNGKKEGENGFIESSTPCTPELIPVS